MAIMAKIETKKRTLKRVGDISGGIIISNIANMAKKNEHKSSFKK